MRLPPVLSARLKLLVCAASLASFGALSAHADVIYRETFGRPPGNEGGDLATYTFGWHDFLADGSANTVIGNSGINGSSNGNPTDVANVNAGLNSDGTTAAYANGLHFILTGAGAPLLTFTSEFNFDPTAYTDIEFSWVQGNANTADTMRLALQVGSSWYVSANAFSTAAMSLGNFSTQGELKTVAYDPTAANWLMLNFDGTYDGNTAGTATASSGALALAGAPGGDLSGMINGFGLYIEGAAGTRRFDTFAVNATPVPEPSTYALLAGAAVLAGAVVRRRLRGRGRA